MKRISGILIHFRIMFKATAPFLFSGEYLSFEIRILSSWIRYTS